MAFSTKGTRTSCAYVSLGERPRRPKSEVRTSGVSADKVLVHKSPITYGVDIGREIGWRGVSMKPLLMNTEQRSTAEAI